MLRSFLNEGDVAADFAMLVRFVAERSLRVEIAWRGSWERMVKAADALRGRLVNGKAVLDVRPRPNSSR